MLWASNSMPVYLSKRNYKIDMKMFRAALFIKTPNQKQSRDAPGVQSVNMQYLYGRNSSGVQQ